MFSLVGSRALILCFYLDGAIIFYILGVFFSPLLASIMNLLRVLMQFWYKKKNTFYIH